MKLSTTDCAQRSLHSLMKYSISVPIYRTESSVRRKLSACLDGNQSTIFNVYTHQKLRKWNNRYKVLKNSLELSSLDTLELKDKALDAYKNEMRAWPHTRSIKAVEYLARWRGASVGCEAAEAFMLIRNIT